MPNDYRTLFNGLQSTDKRVSIASDELSACEQEVIRLMREGAKAKVLPLITLQFVGNAWKIYHSKPIDHIHR